MAGKDDVVAVHVIARNGGQSYGAQGQVLLTLKVLPHSRDRVTELLAKIATEVGVHVYVKAKIGEERPIGLGDFQFKTISYSGKDGSATIKLSSLENYVETDNLRLLPLASDPAPDFIVRFEADGKVDGGGGGATE